MISLALMALQFTQTGSANEQGGAGGVKRDWLRDTKRMGSALLFRYQDPEYTRKEKKKIRNRIYSSCAWVIVVGVVLALVQNFWSNSAKDVTQWLFWFEALAIVAFGVSWLVKGEAVLKDGQTIGAEEEGQHVVAAADEGS